MPWLVSTRRSRNPDSQQGSRTWLWNDRENTSCSCAYHIFFVLMLVAVLNVPTVHGQSVKMIDVRLMLLAHPLFQRFSPESKRFSGTLSEFIQGGEKGVQDFEKSIADMERALENLLQTWPNRWQQCRNAADRRNLERAFLDERKLLEDRIALGKARLMNARQVPGRPGLTLGNSILSQVLTLEADLKKATQIVQKNFGGPVVDISHLQPSPWVQPDLLLLAGNRNFSWAQSGHNVVAQDLAWIHEAKALLLKLDLTFSPIPLGAADGREEAVQAVRAITLEGER